MFGSSVDKYVVDCAHVIFSEGQQSARGLAEVLGYKDDEAIHASRAEMVKQAQLKDAYMSRLETWDDLKGAPVDFERFEKVGDSDGLKKLYAEYLNLTAKTVDDLFCARGCALFPPEKVELLGKAETDESIPKGYQSVDFLEKVRWHVRYIIFGTAKEGTVPANTGGSDNRDTGHDGWTLEKFHENEHATNAGLTLEEVAALRIYTSLIFRLINGPLRRPEAIKQLERRTHPLALT
jgi:hypothetical protein